MYLFSTLQSASFYQQVCFGPDQINRRLAVSRSRGGDILYI